MHYLPLQVNLPLTIDTGWAPCHEKLYNAVSHILTLTLTKSSIAQTANCFPRLLNLHIVYIISSLPRLPHTALTVFRKQHYYQLPHVEYSQYKNSFITRCLFNFRRRYVQVTMNSVTDYIDNIITFPAFSMYYRSFLYVLTTHVTVCICHTEIKDYLLTAIIKPNCHQFRQCLHYFLRFYSVPVVLKYHIFGVYSIFVFLHENNRYLQRMLQ